MYTTYFAQPSFNTNEAPAIAYRIYLIRKVMSPTDIIQIKSKSKNLSVELNVQNVIFVGVFQQFLLSKNTD